MSKSSLTDERVAGFLRQAKAGVAVTELCRATGFSDSIFSMKRELAAAQASFDAQTRGSDTVLSGSLRPWRRRHPRGPHLALRSS